MQQRVGGFLRSWSRSALDVETDEYFTALSEDLAPSGHPEDARLTVRSARAISTHDTVEPFVGSRLPDWNAQCLASPYGMVFSKVSGWRTTQMRASDGQSLEVQAIGSINPAEMTGDYALSDWMVDRVRERDIDVYDASPLERLVFEDGRIVGVMLATSDGPLAVGVRFGLVITSSDPFVADSDVLPPCSDDLQVSVVGPAASRFRRIELLDTAGPGRPVCTASGRQLHDAMREPRSLPSGAGSCGKLR